MSAPTIPRMRIWLPLLLGCVGVVLVGAACGGGSPSDADETPRITDPGSVQTATPLSGALTYEIRGNSVSIPQTSSTPTTSGTPSPTNEMYTVAPGDSCSAIAAALEVTVEALREANPPINVDCTNLQPGDQLNVPGAAAQPTPEPGETPSAEPTQSGGSGETYTVQSGDTCVDIAASFDVDVEELIALNGLDASCTLSIDQVLQIP